MTTKEAVREVVKDEAVKSAVAKSEKEAVAKANEAEERMALEAYRDEEQANGEISDKYIDYVKLRYEQVKGDFITLMCNQREADGSKNEEMKNRLSGLFTANYRTRKWAVKELRAAGQDVKDKYFPG